MRTPEGSYYEKHLPIDTNKAYAMTVRDRSAQALEPAPAADANGVPAPKRKLHGMREKVRTLYYADDVDKPTTAELEEAHHHAEHEAHAELEGVSADGHQFDGHHAVEDETLRGKH